MTPSSGGSSPERSSERTPGRSAGGSTGQSAGRRPRGLRRPILAVLLLAAGGLLLSLPALELPERRGPPLVELAVPPDDPWADESWSPTPLDAMPAPPLPPDPLGLELPPEDPQAAAWRRYAVPVPPAEGRPRIAVVIDDLGLNAALARRTLELPGPLTLSFMTYAEGLEALGAAGRARGHELMLHVPMEPGSEAVDAGPRALHVEQDRNAVLDDLAWGLDRLSGYVGINNHMGSRFTADSEAMRPVLAELRARGLLFLDSRTSTRSVGEALARELGVPTASRDVFLDHEISEAFIRRQLAETEAVARRRGTAIAIGHPYPLTLELLAEWLPGLEARGYQLVPVSAVIIDRERRPRRPLAETGAGAG